MRKAKRNLVASDFQEINWKDALSKKLIHKHQLFIKQPKKLVYGKSKDFVEFHDSPKNLHLLIEVDDDFLAARYQYFMLNHFESKETAKKFIDKAWIEPEQQEVNDTIDKLEFLVNKSTNPDPVMVELIKELKNKNKKLL